MDRLTHYQAAVDCGVRSNKSLRLQGRYLIAIGQNNRIIASSPEGPKIWLGRMLDIQVFEIDGFFGWKCMENALKQWPMLIAMHPMFIYTGFRLFKFEPGKGMKGKPKPVFPFDHQVTDEQTLCCTCQVQDPDHVVYFACANWTDGTLKAGILVPRS